MSTVISVENVSKAYRLGLISGGTLKEDVSRWWARLRGKSDPFLKIGEEHHARKMGEQFWALDDVSFQVKQGEVLGIIGRNGAGKSTLLKILSQVTSPTSGQIKIKGRIASLLEVGTGFHPELTGRENIFLNGAILGMTKAEIRKKFDEIVAFSGIEEFIDTPVKRYSSGMYVRLAFAVAAHLEPEILIVDEVLAVGDAEFQKKCMGKMKDVAVNGRTILFVSHNLEAVRKLCNRGVLLENGQVIFAGPTDSVIRKYINSDSSLKTKFQIPPPTEKNARAYATILTIEDPTGLPSNGFAVGKPWQIRVAFTVTRRIEHFIVGLGLVSDRNIAVWTIWSKPRDLEPGHYQAVFLNEQVSLCTGSYSIVVGLSSNEKPFHQIEEAATLVLAEINEISEAVKATGDCGFIVNQLPARIFRTEQKEKLLMAKEQIIETK
jgi:lipopolysaccharide transport system ATP-binding protein